jgi:hypothetical protein
MKTTVPPQTTIPSAVDSAEVAESLSILKRDGYCVMKGIIPADAVGAVRESVRKSVHQHSDTPAPLGHVSGFLRVDQSYAPYLADLRLMAVVDRLFGEFFRISFVTGSLNAPGIKRGPVHADWPYNQNAKARVRAPYPDVLMNLVTMWMLTDYTVENGGTLVIPGSHKRDHSPQDRSRVDPNAKYEGEVQLVGKAGDVGLFDARTWHAIAPNVSDHERVGFIVRYAPWWINLQPLRPGSRDRRQINDATGGDDSKVEPVPLSVYERLPENLKPLVYHMVDESN